MLLYLYQSPTMLLVSISYYVWMNCWRILLPTETSSFFIETNIKIVLPKHAKAHHLRMLRAQNDEMIKSQHSKWKSRPAIAKYLTEHVSNHTHALVVKFHRSLFVVFLVGFCPRSGWANQEHELLENFRFHKKVDSSSWQREKENKRDTAKQRKVKALWFSRLQSNKIQGSMVLSVV